MSWYVGLVFARSALAADDFMSLAWQVDLDVEDSWFGASVSSAGDVNGDGFDDVLVGAPLFDDGALVDVGAAFVFLSTTDGPETTPSWSFASDVPDSGLGWNVSSAGDVNGDGFDDVILGAYLAGSGGEAYVFHGSAFGLATAPSWIGSSTEVSA